VVELENLALRHRLHVLRPADRVGRAVRDRPLALGRPLPIVPTLSGSDGVGQTNNGDLVAVPTGNSERGERSRVLDGLRPTLR
jgi:hypothetical protein